MIEIKMLESNNDVVQFCDYKIKCIKYHIPYAQSMGINDVECDRFGMRDAVKYFSDPSWKQLLIFYNKQVIGAIEYKIQQWQLNQEETSVYISFSYIDESFRGRGIYKEVISQIEKLADHVEFEIYYNLESHEIHEKMGYRVLSKRYFK